MIEVRATTDTIPVDGGDIFLTISTTSNTHYSPLILQAASGVQATPECFEAYQSLKRSQYKYIVFKLSDDKKSIVVDAKVEKDSAKDPEGNYTAFTAALPEQDCRWVVYDFDYTKEDESTKMLMQKNKIIFLSWYVLSVFILSSCTVTINWSTEH